MPIRNMGALRWGGGTYWTRKSVQEEGGITMGWDNSWNPAASDG